MSELPQPCFSSPSANQCGWIDNNERRLKESSKKACSSKSSSNFIVERRVSQPLQERIDDRNVECGRLGRMYLTPCLSLSHVKSSTSEILPHLLISTSGSGLVEDVEFLRASNIKFLVNCCEKSTRLGERGLHLRSDTDDLTVLHLNLKDESKQALNVAFDKFFPLVQRAKEENAKCLIYCHSGMSRSVSLVLAYLLACESMSLIDALSHVKERRLVASPNPGFMEQLIQLERTLTATVTVDLDRYRNDRFGDPLSFAIQIRASLEQEDWNGKCSELQISQQSSSSSEGWMDRKNEKRKRPVGGGMFNFSISLSSSLEAEEADEDKENVFDQSLGIKESQSDISIVFRHQNSDAQLGNIIKKGRHRRPGSDISIILRQGLSKENELTSSSSTDQKKHRRHGSDISITISHNFAHTPTGSTAHDEFSRTKDNRSHHKRSTSDISIFFRKVFAEERDLEENLAFIEKAASFPFFKAFHLPPIPPRQEDVPSNLDSRPVTTFPRQTSMPQRNAIAKQNSWAISPMHNIKFALLPILEDVSTYVANMLTCAMHGEVGHAESAWRGQKSYNREGKLSLLDSSEADDTAFEDPIQF